MTSATTTFHRLMVLMVLFVLYGQVSAQSNNSLTAKLSGRVTNIWTGEGAFSVNVFIPSLQMGTVTDAEGYYEMVIPKGTFKIQFSRIDLKYESRFVDVIKNIKLNIEMKEEIYNLDAVTVYSQKQDAQVKSLDVGKKTLSIDRISSLPSFMGETDVIKSLILLPGVSTVGEGSSGFNVRGGGVDQNLILQDGGLIFNPSHVFGFFSVFNPAVVNNATLYKSGVPAKYGGRLSSVLNVELKEGDYKDYHMDAGLGIVSSKLAFNGPIIKDKLSFLIGSRASYSDWLLQTAKASEFKNSTASFFDLNLKLSLIANEKNKISYSGYYSKDGFGFASDTTFDWSTFNHSLLWKHIISEDAVLDFNLVTGRYAYNIDDPEGINSFKISSAIRNHTLRSDFTYEWDERNKINIGAEATLYEFSPGTQKPLDSDSGVDFIKLEDERALETGIYIEDDFKISSRLSIRAGLRFSTYHNFGPGTDYIFQAGDSKKIENVIDTIFHEDGKIFKSYSGLEPRVNLTYLMNRTSSIKVSYNRSRQYLHLISNTAATTPTDFWKTSNFYIEPEIGDQFSAGYFRNFKNNSIEASAEAYYKVADNIVDFKNGSTLLMNEYIESDLITGTSEAYGLELFLNKKTGHWTGWASYTYSRIFRKVNGTYEDEKISNGNAFPANFDKPHDLTLAVNYSKNPVVKYGINFSYSTGRPSTVPLGVYDVSNLTNVFSYSLRNQERIPDYHRMDVSMTINSKPKVDRKWKMSWTFAIYNLYGRKNAYSVFFENKNGSPPKAYQLSILGSPFPSLTANFSL
ncbi:MAG: TonB-dependent receptor [Cyclobacteriaceae bacterium]